MSKNSSLRKEIPRTIGMDARSEVGMSGLASYSNDTSRNKINKLKSKHKSKFMKLEQNMNEKKKLQDEVNILGLKIENDGIKTKEKDVIIEARQSRSDIIKDQMLKDRKQMLEVNEHAINTKVLNSKMNEVLKNASELEMENDQLEESSNANAKRITS